MNRLVEQQIFASAVLLHASYHTLPRVACGIFSGGISSIPTQINKDHALKVVASKSRSD